MDDRFQVSKEFTATMARAAAQFEGIGECSKAFGRLVERAFPNGAPKMSKGFDIAAGGPQLVDVPRGISAELLDPVVIEAANDA